jgi:hypothetical protein
MAAYASRCAFLDGLIETDKQNGRPETLNMLLLALRKKETAWFGSTILGIVIE